MLVAPVWKTHAWYPTLLEMLTDLSVMLKHPDGLIQPITPTAAPEVEPQLATWPISGNTTKMKNFRHGHGIAIGIMEDKVLQVI